MVTGGGGLSPVEEVLFWAQTLEDSRRTVVCRPELADQVRQLLEAHGVAGMFDVREDRWVPEGQILVMDHNAIDAATRQALQRVGRHP